MSERVSGVRRRGLPPVPCPFPWEGEGVTGGEDKDSRVPLLVEILDFGFHLGHEGGERAFASYNEHGRSNLSKKRYAKAARRESRESQRTSDVARSPPG